MARMACASCAATASLSRCGRCKRVAYCSVECQRRHWTRGGHRALCPSLAHVAAFRAAETRFWTTRSAADLALFAAHEGGLDPASMRFYGEVLFVLVGLKPIVLFSNLPASWRRAFVADVIVASGVVSDDAFKLCVVAGNVQTPAAYALDETLVLVNTAHPECNDINSVLRLAPVALDDPEFASSNGSMLTVGEATLARVLDYPIALDECCEPMIEIGYFAVAADGTRELLLSYCASAIPAHVAQIREHFNRYQRAFDAATLTLALETTPLSSNDAGTEATLSRRVHLVCDLEEDATAMSGGSGYNDWESDLSSIIEKTNQNLKMLRRIGDRRTDLGSNASYDVSTTSARPAPSSAAQIASDMRSFASSISNRYAAEDAASSARHVTNRHASTTSIPRAASASTAGSRKLHRSSSVEVDSRARARESLIIRPATTTTHAFGSDGEDESDERSPRVRPASGVGRASGSSSGLKRSSSLAAPSSKSKSGGTSSTRASATAAYPNSNNAVPVDGSAFDDLRKSLEVHIASRSSAFEKVVADLRTDVTVVTSETNALGMKMQELRDAVTAKLTSAAATASSVVEHGDSIGRLEKHSAVLLGWKVGVDQDLFEMSSKLKSFNAIQEKMNSLEGHLEGLGTAIKAATRTARHDEKIEELKDRIAMLERQAANQLDAKAVEHTVQMRVSKEINELENRFNQNLQFMTQKIESKLQSLEKTVQSDRIDAIASVKSDLLEDIDKLETRVVKKSELTPIQNAHTQMKDDIAHIQLFFERQDKRFQELKQNSTQMRDELVETRHELTKALHAQQSRVSTTLEERVGQLTILTKDKNAKAEQKVAVLEKRFKKVEEQCKHLHESVAKVKQDALTQRAADTVTQQREAEKLRQRLVRTIAELEQLQTSKQDLERAFEMQDRQSQAKLKELKAQIDEQERRKEALQAEMLQAVQSESRQIGMAQGRNALLESLLTREKQESEEKAQQVHKARQEIAQIRQKMRTLENDVDKKMQKLSSELLAKQTQIEGLTKKLTRSEDEAQKLSESSKREKKLLTKTKELKQQELALTKMKLKELEKVAAGLRVEAKSFIPVIDDLAPKLAEMEAKRNEQTLVLTERQAEVEELRAELKDMKAEHDELLKKHARSMDTEVQHLNTEYGKKILALQHEIEARDAETLALRERLDDKSELEALSDALSEARREKESLLEQLQSTRVDHERQLHETEASLHVVHSTEMQKLQTQIETRVADIASAQRAIDASRERIASLESEIKLSAEMHKEEITRLATEMKGAKSESERLSSEMEELRVEKQDVENELGRMRTELESISAGDEELLDEMENVRQQHEELCAERDRLIDGLRAKAEEVAELKELEAQHRERIEQLLRDQNDARERVEGEIEAMRRTLEQERGAAGESERQLQRTIDVLQAEIEAAKKQAQGDAASASGFQAELQRIKRELESSVQSEANLQARLDRIMQELTTVMGAELTVDQEPGLALQSHFDAVAEKHAQDLAALALRHEQALKEATADHDRIHELETQIAEVTTQIEDLDVHNQGLRSELVTQCAEHALRVDELGRLQDEIATVLDDKHALEEQVAELSSQVEELEAALASQADEKEAEVAELTATNAKLTTTVSDIRDTMERLERDKTVELESLNNEIQALEGTLTALNEQPRTSGASMEKEVFANQQTVAAAGQAIRDIYAKLHSGCSIVQLQDLKASLVAAESKRTQACESFRREQQRLGESNDTVLLNVEFLDSLVHGWNTNDSIFAAKYVHTAPALAARLARLQELFQDALKQCVVHSPAPVDEGKLEAENIDERREPDAADEEGPLNYFDQIDDEEELEGMSEEEQSAELSTGDALDESQCEDDARIDNETEETEETDAPDTVATTLNGTAELRLSLDMVGPHADACTTLINSPTTAVLSSDSFKPAIRLDVPPRAEASTTLLHSPTATLLERRFEPRSVEKTLPTTAVDDREDACTSLPTSPTAMLLQERFEPLPRRLEVGDNELIDDDEEDMDRGAFDDRELEDEHEANNGVVHEAATGSPQTNTGHLSGYVDDREREFDAGSNEDNDEHEQLHGSEGETDEEEEVGHEDSLSQSLEAMIRLAAENDVTSNGLAMDDGVVAANASQHEDDEDELIDDERDQDVIEGDDADEGVAVPGDDMDPTQDDQDSGWNSHEHEESHEDVDRLGASTFSQHDHNARMAADALDEFDAMEDVRAALRPSVSRSTAYEPPPVPQHDEEEGELDDEDEEAEADLDGSLDRSADKTNALEDVFVAADESRTSPLAAEREPTSGFVDPLGEKATDDDGADCEHDSDGDIDEEEDMEELSDLGELEDSLEAPIARDSAQRPKNEIHRDVDEQSPSGCVDAPADHALCTNQTSRILGHEQRLEDADENADDEERAESLPVSSEGSPVKPTANASLLSVPSLPLSRLVALRSDSDDDDELHAAQLSMDLQRRGMSKDDDFDNSFDDLEQHEERAESNAEVLGVRADPKETVREVLANESSTDRVDIDRISSKHGDIDDVAPMMQSNVGPIDGSDRGVVALEGEDEDDDDGPISETELNESLELEEEEELEQEEESSFDRAYPTRSEAPSLTSQPERLERSGCQDDEAQHSRPQADDETDCSRGVAASEDNDDDREDFLSASRDQDDDLDNSIGALSRPPAEETAERSRHDDIEHSSASLSIPSLRMSRLSALRSESDDDEELHAVQLSMDLERTGVSKDDEFDDGFGDLEQSEERTEGEEDAIRGAHSQDGDPEMSVGENRRGESLTERLQIGNIPSRRGELEEAQPVVYSSTTEATDADRGVTGLDGENENEDDEPISEADLNESLEEDGEEESSFDQVSPARPLASALSSQERTQHEEDTSSDTRLHAVDPNTDVYRVRVATKNEDEDREDVLSASRDEDDDQDRDASLDDREGSLRPTATTDHDEDNDVGDHSLADDSMDEVERLLLQHAELATSESTAVEGKHQFASTLRMDDDDDELIDSESDEEANDALGLSLNSNADDEGELSTSQADDARAARDLDASTDSRDDALQLQSALADEESQDDSLPRKRLTAQDEDEDADEDDDEVDRPSAHPTLSSFVPAPRAALRSFGDSDDDDEEENAVAAPLMTQLGSQLPPLSALGSRARGGGGSGSLMKALQATRGAIAASEFDDDDDDVEKLMTSKSLQRKPIGGSEQPVSAPSSLSTKVRDSEFDDDDDEVEKLLTASSQAIYDAKPSSGMTASIATRRLADESEDDDDVSSQRPQPATDRTMLSTLTSRAHDHEFDDDDDEIERLMTQQRAQPKAASTVESHVRDAHENEITAETTSEVLAPATHDEGDDGADEIDELDESLLEDEPDDDASGTFGVSFGDDVLDRALDGPKAISSAPSTAITSTRQRAESDSDEDVEGDRPKPALMTSGLLGPGRPPLGALPSLAKKPLPGLSALTRGTIAMDDDDDMDEVERLLHAQTSMRTAKPLATSAPSPRHDANLPMHDEFARFDGDDDDDDASPAKAPPSPSRIPILPGSSLLHKPLAASPIASRPRLASARSDDDGADAYLEDSFDLEESLQEEEEA